MYDVIIIGAGPAGISAGIYAVSRGQKALILEKFEECPLSHIMRQL